MSNEAIGTPKAHYAGPDSGPFKCGNCSHERWGNCNHPDVIEDAKKGYGGLKINPENKLAVIDKGGCCTYFR